MFINENDSPAELVQTVRKGLRMTVPEIADTLGVSRQQVYEWTCCGGISEEEHVKLASLARFAETILSLNVNFPRVAIETHLSPCGTYLDEFHQLEGNVAPSTVNKAIVNVLREQAVWETMSAAARRRNYGESEWDASESIAGNFN